MIEEIMNLHVSASNYVMCLLFGKMYYVVLLNKVLNDFMFNPLLAG